MTLFWALIAELVLDEIHFAACGHTKRRKSGDHILILSEGDSAFGRALSDTFQDEASKMSIAAGVGDGYGPRIGRYRYMHGIDGRLPTDSSKDESRDDSAKKQDSSAGTSGEATEGSNQSDFLRRLAKSLKQEEQKWQNRGD